MVWWETEEKKKERVGTKKKRKKLIVPGRNWIDLELDRSIMVGHMLTAGAPRQEKTSWSCLTSSLPRNSGLPVHSSTNIHPSDHMSTATPYFVAPSIISGARYHSVITLGLRHTCATGCGMNLAMPKSAILMSPRLLYKRFDIFKSRWMIRRSWRWWRPESRPSISRFTPPSPNLHL